MDIKFNTLIKKKINEKSKIQICKLKDSNWKYGINNQINWFNLNINDQDLHNLMIIDKKICPPSSPGIERIFKNARLILISAMNDSSVGIPASAVFPANWAIIIGPPNSFKDASPVINILIDKTIIRKPSTVPLNPDTPACKRLTSI